MARDLPTDLARKLAAEWLEARGHEPDAKNVVGQPLIDIVIEDGTPERIRRTVLLATGIDIAEARS